MKKLFFCMLAGAMILTACNKPAAKQEAAAVESETLAEGNAIEVTLADSVSISFNNEANTAELNFRGETVTLKGDTVASGIRYSNDVFTYVEHQGEITITKDGETVFYKQPE